MNVDVVRVLARNGIPDWQYFSSEDAIPLIHFIRALGVGARATGDIQFGNTVSERNRWDDLAGFGEAVTGAMTVYDAMRTSCRLATKEATTVHFWLQRAANGVLFCRKQLVATPEIAAALMHLERYTLTLLMQIVQLGAGPDWRPAEAWLSVVEDPDVPEWRAFADTRLHFRAPCSAIRVPEHVLCLPIADYGNGAAVTASAAERRLRETWADSDLADTLRLALRALIRQRCADVDTAAEIAGISRRTLQRRLANQGTNFSEVLAKARYQAAERLLRQSDDAIADISDHVGYEHPQHFIRAFRRWAGVTPGDYRGALAMANAEHMGAATAR